MMKKTISLSDQSIPPTLQATIHRILPVLKENKTDQLGEAIDQYGHSLKTPNKNAEKGSLPDNVVGDIIGTAVMLQKKGYSEAVLYEKLVKILTSPELSSGLEADHALHSIFQSDQSPVPLKLATLSYLLKSAAFYMGTHSDYSSDMIRLKDLLASLSKEDTHGYYMQILESENVPDGFKREIRSKALAAGPSLSEKDFFILAGSYENDKPTVASKGIDQLIDLFTARAESTQNVLLTLLRNLKTDDHEELVIKLVQRLDKNLTAADIVAISVNRPYFGKKILELCPDQPYLSADIRKMSQNGNPDATALLKTSASIGIPRQNSLGIPQKRQAAWPSNGLSFPPGGGGKQPVESYISSF